MRVRAVFWPRAQGAREGERWRRSERAQAQSSRSKEWAAERRAGSVQPQCRRTHIVDEVAQLEGDAARAKHERPLAVLPSRGLFRLQRAELGQLGLEEGEESGPG